MNHLFNYFAQVTIVVAMHDMKLRAQSKKLIWVGVIMSFAHVQLVMNMLENMIAVLCSDPSSKCRRIKHLKPIRTMVFQQCATYQGSGQPVTNNI